MRAFIAVEVSNPDTLAEIREIQSGLQIDGRSIMPQNVHFTLSFLGEISKSVADAVYDAMTEIKFEPFEIAFVGVGTFPGSGFPRIVWVGVDNAGRRGLANLAARIEDVLGPLGFRPSMAFKPHATIFRVKSKIGDIRGYLEKFHNAELGRQEVNELKFKKSVLGPNGPSYSDLGAIRA